MTEPIPKIRIVSTHPSPSLNHTLLTIESKNKMKGAEPDLSAATYQIHDESHTIGNALRWMLMNKYV